MINESYSDSAQPDGTDTNRPLNKNSGRVGSITGDNTFPLQQKQLENKDAIISEGYLHSRTLHDAVLPNRPENIMDWTIDNKKLLNKTTELINEAMKASQKIAGEPKQCQEPETTNGSEKKEKDIDKLRKTASNLLNEKQEVKRQLAEASKELKKKEKDKKGSAAIRSDLPPPYDSVIKKPVQEKSDFPEDRRLLSEIKQNTDKTHQSVQTVSAAVNNMAVAVDNMAKMQEESKQREEENNRNISRMQEAQSSMERTIDDLKTMLQKREEHDEALKQDQATGIQRHEITSKVGNSFGQGCKKCGCRRLCPCSCHREKRNDENRKDISEYIPRASAFDHSSHRGQAVENLDASKLNGASGNLRSDPVHTDLSDENDENINDKRANTDRLTSGTCAFARSSDDLSSSHDYDKDDETDNMSGEQRRPVYRKRRTKCTIGCKTHKLNRKYSCPYHWRQQRLLDKSGVRVNRKYKRKNGTTPNHPKTRGNVSDRKSYLKRVQDFGGESDDTDEVSETFNGNGISAGSSTSVSDEQSNDFNSDNNDAFAAFYQCDFGGASASGGPPGDPSSGGDDNKDHDDRRRRQNTPRKSMWSIDPDAWEQCMKLEKEEECKQEVECLLKKSKLPDRKSLNEACRRFGRKSDAVRKIGNAVCGYLKQKYECIVDVWPGYRCDDKSVYIDVVFVVLTNNLQSIEGENYTLYCRGMYETKTKSENIEIAKREKKELPKDEEIQKLKQVQRKVAPCLMDKHKRLVRVTVSTVKHTAGEMSPVAFTEQLCLALYVQIRGLVPLDEEPFDKQIQDYQVDVREGLVRLCNKPDDYHDPLKMGCCITGEKSGSLGPFLMFENRPNSQYALTCAHVLLSDEYLKYVFEKGIQEKRDIRKVYQPYITNTEDYFGEVVLAFHSKGTEHSAGMEIGLIHVQSRLPVMGNFPDADFSIAGIEQQDQFVLTSDEVLNTLDKSANVFKYGSKSLLTKGTLRTEGSSIRTIPVNNISRDMVLHGQIEVQSVGGIPFAVEGDSGALVMAFSSQSGQLAAVGILEGYFSDDDCFFVTPLADILKELERIKGTKCYFNKFVNRKETDITVLVNRVDKIEKQLKQGFSSHKRGINRRLKKLRDEHKEENEEIKSQLQKLSDDQKRQRDDQKEENTNINNQFDHILQILMERLPERNQDNTLPENTADK